MVGPLGVTRVKKASCTPINNAFTFALDTSSSTELMSGAKSRKWVHQKPTNQPTFVLTWCTIDPEKLFVSNNGKAG